MLTSLFSLFYVTGEFHRFLGFYPGNGISSLNAVVGLVGGG